MEAQNALGQGIVDSQNALGQGIVGELYLHSISMFVDFSAQIHRFTMHKYLLIRCVTHSFYSDSQNYITLQHNVLGEWLHTNLCVIYEALDGSCSREVGPLKEDQVFIPMQLHWPEGQPNIVQRLERVQSVISIAAADENGAEGKNGNVSNFARANVYSGDLEAVKNKVDALSTDMQSRIDALSIDMQGKADALSTDMQGKVDLVEGKVDSVKSELKELKDMISTLMGMMAKDDSE